MGGGPFEPVRDPNGDWLVWDAVRENVAESDGYVFVGLTQREALRLSTLMNDVKGRTDGSAYVLRKVKPVQLSVAARYRVENGGSYGGKENTWWQVVRVPSLL